MSPKVYEGRDDSFYIGMHSAYGGEPLIRVVDSDGDPVMRGNLFSLRVDGLERCDGISPEVAGRAGIELNERGQVAMPEDETIESLQRSLANMRDEMARLSERNDRLRAVFRSAGIDPNRIEDGLCGIAGFGDGLGLHGVTVNTPEGDQFEVRAIRRVQHA